MGWVESFRRARPSTLVLLFVLPPVSGYCDRVGLSFCASVVDRLLPVRGPVARPSVRQPQQVIGGNLVKLCHFDKRCGAWFPLPIFITAICGNANAKCLCNIYLPQTRS